MTLYHIETRRYRLREFSQMIRSCKYNHELNMILNIKIKKKHQFKNIKCCICDIFIT
jgi:hypothetical protein